MFGGRTWRRYGSVSHNRLVFSRKTLKMSPTASRLHKNYQNRQRNRVSVAQLCKKKLRENKNFLQRIFSIEISASLHFAVRKEHGRIWVPNYRNRP